MVHILTTVRVAITESLHSLLYSVANGRSLGRNETAVHLVEEEFHRAVVTRQRHLDIAAAGEDHQRDAVAPQLGEQVVHNALAAFQSVGLHILRHHAVRHIEADGDVAPEALTLHQLAAFLGIGKSHHHKRRRQHQQAEFERRPPW